MALRFVVFLLFASIVAIFALQNAAEVGINFIRWQIAVPQALIILLSVLLGAATAYLLGGIQTIKLRGRLKELGKEKAQLEAENARLLQGEPAEVQAEPVAVATPNSEEEAETKDQTSPEAVIPGSQGDMVDG